MAPDFAQKLHPLGTIFLNMVKMIIAPLLFATLVVGIAGHGDAKSIGKIGIKTIIYFEIVTTLALGIGLIVGNLLQPGAGFNIAVNPMIFTRQLKWQGQKSTQFLIRTGH